jgi:hypothetical protein
MWEIFMLKYHGAGTRFCTLTNYSLGTNPVVAQVSDLFIVVQPKKCIQLDKTDKLVIKKQKLEAYENSKQVLVNTHALTTR